MIRVAMILLILATTPTVASDCGGGRCPESIERARERLLMLLEDNELVAWKDGSSSAPVPTPDNRATDATTTAVVLFKAAPDCFPESALLAAGLAGSGDYAKAAEVHRRALVDDPSPERARLLALAYLGAAFADEASAIARARPGDPDMPAIAAAAEALGAVPVGGLLLLSTDPRCGDANVAFRAALSRPDLAGARAVEGSGVIGGDASRDSRALRVAVDRLPPALGAALSARLGVVAEALRDPVASEVVKRARREADQHAEAGNMDAMIAALLSEPDQTLLREARLRAVAALAGLDDANAVAAFDAARRHLAAFERDGPDPALRAAMGAVAERLGLDDLVPEGPDAPLSRARAFLRRGLADDAWTALGDPTRDPELAAQIAAARGDRTTAQRLAAARGASATALAVDLAWANGEAELAASLIESIPVADRRASDVRRLTLVRAADADDEIDRIREALANE